MARISKYDRFEEVTAEDILVGVDVDDKEQSDAGTTKNLTVDQLVDPLATPISESQALATNHVKRVVDLAALRAVTGMQANQAVEMVATGRAGLFRWDASDLSEQVAADPMGGIYVPPAGQDGSAGAWVRSLDDGMVRGDYGKRYRFVGGVLRNNAGTWEFLKDANHDPVGNVSVSLDSPTVLRITHKFTGYRNVTAIVVPDEAYARLGMTCGVSSSPDNARITCYLPLEFVVTTNGADAPTIDIAPEIAGRISKVSRNGFNIRVVHNGAMKDAPQVTPMGGSTVPFVMSYDATSIEINQHSFAPYAYQARYTESTESWTLDTNDPAGVTLNVSNFGLNGNVIFSGTTPTVPVYGGNANSPFGDARIITRNQTTMTVKVFGSDGNIITEPVDGFEVTCSRGGGFIPNASTTLPSGSILVRRGYVPCDFGDLAGTTSLGQPANLWVWIVLEIDENTP